MQINDLLRDLKKECSLLQRWKSCVLETAAKLCISVPPKATPEQVLEQIQEYYYANHQNNKPRTVQAAVGVTTVTLTRLTAAKVEELRELYMTGPQAFRAYGFAMAIEAYILGIEVEHPPKK